MAPPPVSAAAYPALHTPIRIGTLSLPHRILMGSMHLNRELGDPLALAAFYVERVRGGAGLIITGGAAVSREGAGGAGYTLINELQHQERWRYVVGAVHDAGGLIGLQLFHAGRYALRSAFGLAPVAPSAVYSGYCRDTPDAMTDAHIAATIADFAAAAEVAVALGFDAVEVMGSEGYLLNQFASPVTNRREDAWGGDAARRRQFPLAVLRAVRKALGSVPMLVRLSGDDLVPGSSTPAEVDALALACVGAGADAIDVGIGWHESRIPTVQSLVPHGAWVPIAARVKAALVQAAHGDAAPGEAAHAVPVVASNRIVSLDQAEEILSAGGVDLVSLARPFLADPRILSKSFAGDPQLVNTCIGCNEACIDRSIGLEPVSCLVNPTAGRERKFSVLPRTSVRVAVVGAGPAGMEAARALADAGARVSLFDAGQRIGGQFLMAGMVPGKADFLQTVRYFEHELARLGVRVELGTAVEDAARLAAFDHVVVSTGVRPRGVAVPGAGLPLVLDYATAFRNPDAVGDTVAIIGAGGIGVDLAHLLCEIRIGSVFGRPAPSWSPDSWSDERASFLIANGLASGTPRPPARQITLMRRSGAIGAGMGITTRWAVVSAIRRAGVRALTDVAYQSIDAGGLWIQRDGIREHIQAHTVVIAAGQERNDALVGSLSAAGIAHTVIGGALAASGANAVTAFEQGLRAAVAIATRR